jgi:uncharacterized membrane protein
MIESVLRLLIAPLFGFFASFIGIMAFFEQGSLLVVFAALLFVVALLMDALKHHFKPYCSDDD